MTHTDGVRHGPGVRTGVGRLTRVIGAAAVAILLATVGAATAQDTGGGQVSLPIGTAGPDASLEDLDGNIVQLQDAVGGRPALIEFWASWCEQCEALQPQMDAVHAQFGDRAEILAVAVAVAQSQRRVRRHVEDAGHSYPFLWDADGAAVRAYKATTTSIVVILDSDGDVAYTGVGPDQDLVGALRRVLGPDGPRIRQPAPAAQ